MNIHEAIVQWEECDGVELFKEMGILEGSKIIDFGCGFGHYTKAAARAVGNDGTVIGIESNKQIVRTVKKELDALSLDNVELIPEKFVDKLSLDNSSADCVLLYDVIHGGGTNRFALYSEAQRVLKKNGILSILPFHLSNFRDEEGKKKKYKIEQIIKEVEDCGFYLKSVIEGKGIHFEKYHSPSFTKKEGVRFENLEVGSVLNFGVNG